MKFSLLRRRKIAFLFLLGVGIPSLALSYLAFRGIRNELAFLEQRWLDEHREISRLIGDTLAQHFTRVDQAFGSAIANRDKSQPDDPPADLTNLRGLHPLVEEVFYLENSAVELLAADLLFLSDGSIETPQAPSWPSPAADRLRSGQEREFQQRNYPAALASYQRAFAAVSDPALKGEALVAIARVQHKAGQLDGALTTCETILGEYGQVNTRAGTPLGPVAHLEHGSLLLETADSVGAFGTFIDLYERLVDGEWILERAQYDFFRGRALESINDIASAAMSDIRAGSGQILLPAVESKESERRQRTERLLLFQATAGEGLNARLARSSGSQTAGGNRFTLESGGQTYLVSLLGRTDSEPGVWGLLLDAGYLRDSIVARFIVGQVDSATTDWAVKDRDGATILARADPPEGTISLNATFAGNFPPWLIEFYQRPQNQYKRLLASSQSVYFYMFLLIASILIFGLILTVRAVTQELELARLKSDFVSTVSHEFKSPLTSIRQLAEMLQAGRVPSEDRRQRYYDVLVEQSSRLSSLVTNILDLARIEEGRKEFQFATVDIGELLRDLVTTTEHRMGHEGYIVEASIEERLPAVRADKDAIAQAISNLIDNAIQYSHDTKQINLRAFASDGSVTMAVEDFGVGIPDDEIDKVFDRFYRGGDALTRSVKGSGLGLTLVKEIVEAHGGTVHVKSRLEEGSTFSIKLPVITEQSDAKDTDR